MKRLILIAVCLLWGSAAAAGTDPALDAALTQALDQFNQTSGMDWAYAVAGQTVDPAVGGVIYLELQDRASGEAVPGVIDWAVAVRQGAGWTILLPGQAGYTAAFEALSANLRAQIDDSALRPVPDPAYTPAADYHAPWEDGEWGTVTRSYGEHGTGKIDFDIAGRAVAAAKAGVVVYASDTQIRNAYPSGAWWYWNTVIVEHGPAEYTLYGHLAPGSIPQAIRDTCEAQGVCHAPVQAGDILGREGNTGYSLNPHLHFEAGQAYGVVSYPDVLDGDQDGDRQELIHGGYLYREQNAAFRGYAPNEVAAWAWGRLEQASHRPLPPPDTNLILNGSFDVHTDGWTPSGQLNWQVQDGVLRVLRLRTSDPPDWASFYQDLPYGTAAHMPLEVSLLLANTSGIRKEVAVSLRNAAGWEYGALTCRLSLPASSPMQRYRLHGELPAIWGTVRLDIAVNPPDGAPAVLVDDVAVRYLPGESWPHTECIF